MPIVPREPQFEMLIFSGPIFVQIVFNGRVNDKVVFLLGDYSSLKVCHKV